MRKLAPVLALALAAGFPAPARDAERPPARSEACREADAAVARARELLAKKDYPAALASVEAAKKGCPEPTSEYFRVHGDVLAGTKSSNDAVMQYHEALRLEPASAGAANGLARVFFVSRRYEQARAVLRNAEAAGAAVDAELKRAIEEKLAKP